MTRAVAEKLEVTLTHREALLLLPTISLDKQGKLLTEEQRKAVEHYLQCDECQTAGLDALLKLQPLTHQQAIELWICRDMTGMFVDAITPYTLGELRAIEHIMGHQLQKDARIVPVGLTNRFGYCEHALCTKLRGRASSFSDLDQQARCHVIALRGYVAHKWSINDLVDKQRHLLKKYLRAKGKTIQDAAMAIDSLCDLLQYVAGNPCKDDPIGQKLFLHIEQMHHHLIKRGVCNRFGSTMCGDFASDRDCGTGCRFAAMMVLHMHDFLAERMKVPPTARNVHAQIWKGRTT